MLVEDRASRRSRRRRSAALRRVAAGGRHEPMGHAGCRRARRGTRRRSAARGREREHVVPGRVQHPGDVQALAARAGRAGRHPMGRARGEPVDVPGEVDRRVRRDGEDHAPTPSSTASRGGRGRARHEGGAEEPGVLAELRGHEQAGRRWKLSSASSRDASGSKRAAPALGEPAADHDRLGRDGRRELGERERERRRRASSHTRDRVGVARLREREHLAGARHRLAGALRVAPGDGAGRGDGLEAADRTAGDTAARRRSASECPISPA